MKKSTIWIEGILYSCIALFGFGQAYFGSDESSKYLTGPERFWLLAMIGAGAAITGALKMYRSNTFTHFQQERGEGQVPDVKAKEGEKVSEKKTENIERIKTTEVIDDKTKEEKK